MMNELVFFAHTILIASFALAALRLGKSALVAFICTQCILANLFVIKQTTLFGLTATCADAFTIGATLGLNLLQEYFGKAVTKAAIWANFLLLVFYTIITQVHLLYQPASADTTQIHFMPLLELMPRIVIASFLVYLFVQLLDYYLYGLLKKFYHDKHLVLRNYFSIAFCQLIDTILFSFLGLYGLVENIWQIIFISYSIKLVSIVIATPFVSLSRLIRTDIAAN
jgi:queuosine precursor transporter